MKSLKESPIADPPSAARAFHESPGAPERLTPTRVKVRVVEGGDSIRTGARVVLETRLGPIPRSWIAEHTEYRPPRPVADRQVTGPFARWEHQLHLRDGGRGGTILRDEVDDELPLGRLGHVFGGRFARRKLDRMFDYRHARTSEAVETNADRPSGRSA